MKIKSLTQEQKSKLSEYKQMYLDKFFNNKREVSKKEIREYFHWLYSTFDISQNKKPKVILVNSPYEIYVAIKYTKVLTDKLKHKRKNIKGIGVAVRNEVWNEVWNEVGNEVGNEVLNEVWNEVENEVENEVLNEVGKEVWNEVGNEVWNEVLNEVWNEVENEVRSEVRNEKLTYYNYSFYMSGFQSWISFYDFFDKECFPLKKSKLFNDFRKILDLNIFYAVPFDNYVFVSRQAIKYNRNEQKQLHSVSEPAILFGGNVRYHLYYVKGVNIKRPLFKKLCKKEYTFEEWVKEPNEEIKSAIIAFFEEKYGSEYVAQFLNKYLKEVDTYVDKKDGKFLEGTTKGMNIGVYTLFTGNIKNGNNVIKLSFVRCYCPSTDRMFYLSTRPDFNKAKDAVASLYTIPKVLAPHIKAIFRQGERFSTVLTDGGKDRQNKMSKEEISELVSISGSDYFSKMKYEF